MVLTDDDFASIEAAVEEGRHVFDNLQKAIAFVLPTNLGEALSSLSRCSLFPLEGGVPQLPVDPTQILWVNLIATVTLALPLAVEATEPGLMAPPRRARRGSRCHRTFLIVRTVLVSLLCMRCRRSHRSRPARRPDDRGDHDRAVPGRVPARVPLARALDPPRRPPEQPVGARGHRRRPGAAVDLHLRAADAGRLRLCAAQPRVRLLALAAAATVLPLVGLEKAGAGTVTSRRQKSDLLPMTRRHRGGTIGATSQSEEI